MVLKIVDMKRSYEQLIKQHFADHTQMALLTGPRQVGKTTTSQSIQSKNNTYYFNWDDIEDRQRILQGGQVIAAYINIDRLRDKVPLVIFDEIHKYSQWKSFIKGFYDRYHKECRILVTGSARLDVFKKGGDSLMGRYFYYRLHPLSVNELLNRPPSATDIQMPVKIADKAFLNLLKWGGFPEPYLKQDQRFYNRWTRLRKQQLFQEDIRELTNIQGLGQLEILATLIQHQTGELTSYSSLAKKTRVSVDTIRRWTGTLESLYFCFAVRPWTKNITRSLLKEPKYYLWDWSQCTSKGGRNENFIASHLLKAVHNWTDQGLGEYELFFLRDKDKREVDFLVSKNQQPWFIVEVKSSIKEKLSPNLALFQKQLSLKHAFQVAMDGDYIDRDIFTLDKPTIVPAKTFLSQLV